MKKSIGVIGTFLLGMVLCSCAPKEQTPQKEYPDVFPTFNIKWVSPTPETFWPCDDYVLDHFISGNSYICHITVQERSKTFAYQEDFSFKYIEGESILMLLDMNVRWEKQKNSNL